MVKHYAGVTYTYTLYSLHAYFMGWYTLYTALYTSVDLFVFCKGALLQKYHSWSTYPQKNDQGFFSLAGFFGLPGSSPVLTKILIRLYLHPWRLTWNIILQVWFRSFSFLSKWVICRFQPLIKPRVYNQRFQQGWSTKPLESHQKKTNHPEMGQTHQEFLGVAFGGTTHLQGGTSPPSAKYTTDRWLLENIP